MENMSFFLNISYPLSSNPIKWSNTLKQFVAKLPTNCLSLFDHFVELTLKGLSYYTMICLFKGFKSNMNQKIIIRSVKVSDAIMFPLSV